MRYSIIPVRAIEDPNIHGAALRVLLSLGSYTDRDGFCYPSQSTLARRLRVSRQAVNQQIKVLVRLGYLQVTRRKSSSGGETSCLYHIYFENPTHLENEVTGGLHIESGMNPDANAPLWKTEVEGTEYNSIKPGTHTEIINEQGNTEIQEDMPQELETIPTLSETLKVAPAAISDVTSGESLVIAPLATSDIASPAFSDVAQTTQLTSHITNKKKEIAHVSNTPGTTFIPPPSSSLLSSHARDPAFQPDGKRDQSIILSFLIKIIPRKTRTGIANSENPASRRPESVMLLPPSHFPIRKTNEELRNCKIFIPLPNRPG